MNAPRQTPPSPRHLFGPVPSRRFGRSLGVDLVPAKTCSLNCLFCEVGRTTLLTLRRAEYVPTAAVLRELEDWFAGGGEADFVTLAGSGEPTLHTGFGEILRWVNARRGPCTALLSNGTLFPLAEVRRDAAAADVVKVTLSAWDEDSYARLHRPAPGVSLAQMIESYRRFRAEYSGRLWLEVFLVRGVNDAPDGVRRIAELAASVRADRIHLNTAVRPPAEPEALPLPEAELRRLAGFFDPPAELPAAAEGAGTDREVRLEEVAAVLRRRPCTAAQLAASLSASRTSVERAARGLERAGSVSRVERDGEVYFVAARAG
jgi:wyosine [tRNA(Phe)-imidazoG37] synthetase (radical SAM superfamily)